MRQSVSRSLQTATIRGALLPCRHAGRRAAPLLPELVVDFRPGVPASGQQPPLICSRRSCGGRRRGRRSSDACRLPQCIPRRPARMLSASRRCRSTDRSGMPPRSPERPRESRDRTSAPQEGRPASKRHAKRSATRRLGLPMHTGCRPAYPCPWLTGCSLVQRQEDCLSTQKHDTAVPARRASVQSSNESA